MKIYIKQWGMSDQRLTPRVKRAGCTLLSHRFIPQLFSINTLLDKMLKTRSLLVHSYPDLAAIMRHGNAVLVLRNHLCIMRINLQVIDNLKITLLEVLP